MRSVYAITLQLTVKTLLTKSIDLRLIYFHRGRRGGMGENHVLEILVLVRLDIVSSTLVIGTDFRDDRLFINFETLSSWNFFIFLSLNFLISIRQMQ